jgi:hypothetical protein
MQGKSGHSRTGWVEYDALRKRLWILGQRCHHGATGTVVATAACIALIADPAHAVRNHPAPRSLVALAAAAGAALMAHDWKDHSIWFEWGRGSQL